MEKMSLTKALVELKLMDKKIESATQTFVPVTVVSGKSNPLGFKSTEDFTNNAKAKYESVNALIKRKNKIKQALVIANATTEVKIGSETMTIAGAIERKLSIKLEKALLSTMKEKFGAATRKFEVDTAKVTESMMRLLESNFGKDSKAKSEEVDTISKPFMDANAPRLIDPLDIKTKIDALEESIFNFESEVDVILSEANARTEITID